jgi:CspA family cold shock protein
MTRKEKKNKMSIKGKVKWFNPTKGYGFIERDDKEKDVFVHSSAARQSNLDLNEGDELTFEVENGDKGPSAVNLQKS